MTTFGQELARVVTVVSEREDGVIGMSDDGIRVGLRVASGPQTRWLVAYASICAVAKLDPRAVLERNAELVWGTIVPIGGEYVLRCVAPLDSIEAREPATVVVQLLEAARALRPQSLPPSGDPLRVFAHYTD
jgi:hypothetical protein